MLQGEAILSVLNLQELSPQNADHDYNFACIYRAYKMVFIITSQYSYWLNGRAIAQADSHRLPGFEYRSRRVGFVVDKVALWQVFSEYFGFPLPILIPPSAPHSSSGAGTIGQTVADVPSGLSLTPTEETKTTG
jgi:hypothetical protein